MSYRTLKSIIACLYPVIVVTASAQEQPVIFDITERGHEFAKVAKYLQGTCRSTLTVFRQGQSQLTEETLNTFKQGDNASLMIERQIRAGKSTEAVYCINAHYSFVLKRRETGWLLDTLEFPPKAIAYGNDQPLKTHIANSLAIAYPHELRDKTGFKVVKTFRDKGELNVDFRHVYPKLRGLNITPTASGVMRFDLGTKALVAAEMSSTFGAQKSESVVKIEYDGLIEGFPRITKRSVKTVNTQPDASTTTSELREEFDFTFDRMVPDDAFRLAAFGLPEPRGIAWPQSRRTWVWWGIAGILLIMIGSMSRRWWAVSPTAKQPE